MFIAHEAVMSRRGVASTKSMESQILGRMLFPDPGVRRFAGVTTVRGQVRRCRGVGRSDLGAVASYAQFVSSMAGQQAHL